MNALNVLTAALARKFALIVLSGAALLIGLSAQAMTPEERCGALFEIYFTYIFDPTHHQDGEVARAEFARYQCESGHTAEGLATLETILTRSKMPFPKG